jgi:hypothetical protein
MSTGRLAGLIGLIVLVLAVIGLLGELQKRREEHRANVRRDLFAEIQPVSLANCELKRFGEPNDGGYLACADLLGRVKAAYSYGISGYDGWGCDMSRSLNVTTHEYDCFDTKEPVCSGGATRFHAECVGPAKSTDGGRLFDTVEHQLAANGDLGNRPLVMKMDVEGSEWQSLGTAPESVLVQIDQLTVEFHDVDEPQFLATMRRLKQYFHVAHVHFNNWACNPGAKPFPSTAFEVLFVNKNLGVVDPGGHVQMPHPQDAPNRPGVSDCQTTAP